MHGNAGIIASHTASVLQGLPARPQIVASTDVTWPGYLASMDVIDDDSVNPGIKNLMVTVGTKPCRPHIRWLGPMPRRGAFSGRHGCRPAHGRTSPANSTAAAGRRPRPKHQEKGRRSGCSIRTLPTKSIQSKMSSDLMNLIELFGGSLPTLPAKGMESLLQFRRYGCGINVARSRRNRSTGRDRQWTPAKLCPPRNCSM